MKVFILFNAVIDFFIIFILSRMSRRFKAIVSLLFSIIKLIISFYLVEGEQAFILYGCFTWMLYVIQKFVPNDESPDWFVDLTSPSTIIEFMPCEHPLLTTIWCIFAGFLRVGEVYLICYFLSLHVVTTVASAIQIVLSINSVWRAFRY